jgi:DNA-binding helix-hairpin-helix protein with protein kinase domain
MSARLFGSDGRPLLLGRELGRGGEGRVLALPGWPGHVAKCYHRPPDLARQRKLRHMAAQRDEALCRQCAWPVETLHSAPRAAPVVGFVMRAAAGHQPIHRLYSPLDRWQTRPLAHWGDLVGIARNTAAAFAALHARGHVLGDVNQGNVLVADDGRVLLIDCDSYQVAADGIQPLQVCDVGVGHFTPPELQGIARFGDRPRTVQHDLFGLALLVFHLLMGGRHPYAGRPLTEAAGAALEDDIRALRYAYAPDAARRGMAAPPRAIPIDLLPAPMQSMLMRAFTEPGLRGARPRADEWVDALDRLRADLRRCADHPRHRYPRAQTGCPWCALARAGIVHFLDDDECRDVLDSGAPPGVLPSSIALEAQWARIAALQPPPPLRPPAIDGCGLQPAPLPDHLPGPRLRQAAGAIGLLVFVLLTALAPQAPPVFALLAGLLAWQIGESAHALPRLAERRRRRERLDAARRALTHLVEQRAQQAGPQGFEATRARLLAACRQLSLLRSRRHLDARGLSRARALRRRLVRGEAALRRLREDALRSRDAQRALLVGAARAVAQAECDLAALPR